MSEANIGATGTADCADDADNSSHLRHLRYFHPCDPCDPWLSNATTLREPGGWRGMVMESSLGKVQG